MSIWGALKKVVNDNFAYPLNKQHFYPTNFGVAAEYFEESTQYTVQHDGIYVITCVGKGGNGDDAAPYGSENRNYNIKATSGGGGAVCKGYVELKAGQTVNIVVDNTKSAFGDYISAGAGEDGHSDAQNQPAPAAGGAVLIPGNIVNHAGYPGTATGLMNNDAPGGNAGIITPWSLNDGWSQGYLPIVNFTEITGGEGGDENNAGTASSSDAQGKPGKFGGGHGGKGDNTGGFIRAGVRGGGGYGGGGNRNSQERANPSSSSDYRASSWSEGGKGVVIIEHGIVLCG